MNTTCISSKLHPTIESVRDDDPRESIAALAWSGDLLRYALPVSSGGYRYSRDWRNVLDSLVTLGAADLSIARLFEGHLNALQLIGLHGSIEQQDRVLTVVRGGGMLGVWGADGQRPVRLDESGPGRGTLSGEKRYASGAGALRMALVPLTEADGTMRLLLLDVDDPRRVDTSTWDMRGMRRSISGTYVFDGLPVTERDLVGAPDDYRREPYFVGGIWRCGAAQLGAIEAIVRLMTEELARGGRDGHPLQMARIGQAVIKARTARLWIEDTAGRIEGGVASKGTAKIATAVAWSAYGRLATEEAAMAVIDLAERALGLASFASGHPVEALSRDLAVYVRQANPDAVLLQHGRVLAQDLVR